MDKMTITTAKGATIALAGNHNLGTIDATLPNGQIKTVWVGAHPQHGNVLSNNSAAPQFADCVITLTDAQVAEVKAFADKVRAAALADSNTYVGAHRAYDVGYNRVVRAMEG